jgi:hypothetical protein
MCGVDLSRGKEVSDAAAKNIETLSGKKETPC